MLQHLPAATGLALCILAAAAIPAGATPAVDGIGVVPANLRDPASREIHGSPRLDARPAVTQTVTSTAFMATFDPLDVLGVSRPDRWRAKIETKGKTDLYITDNVIPPGGSTGWHSHPGPSLVIVKSGTVTDYMSSDPRCKPHDFAQGSGFIDAGGGEVHDVVNRGTTVAETIAVQFIPTTEPRKVDATEPANCHI
jgi:hypothetical protein